MPDDLAQLTITGLFKELTEVERAIRDCDPAFTPDGDHAVMSSRLVNLAVREQQICDELASRRRDLRREMRSRMFAATVS